MQASKSSVCKNPKLSETNCAVCKKRIVSKEFLRCITCRKYYDVTCTTNVSTKLFRLMTSKSKDIWTCHQCNKDKKKSTSTPTTKCPSNIIIKSPEVATMSDPEELIHTSTDNITHRMKYNINVSTENSFQSLSDDDEQNNSNSTDYVNSNLNRSYNSIRLSTSDEVKEMKEKTANLHVKLEIAENEIDNLMSENYALKKKIESYERKIQCLTKICKSPSKNHSKKPKKKHFHNTFAFHESNIDDTNSKLDQSYESNEAIFQPIITHNKSETVTKCFNKSCRPATTKHQVLLLADETGRGLRNILETFLGSEYSVVSILKPRASLSDLLTNEIISLAKTFNKNDYIIVLAGNHDDNTNNFQSVLHKFINLSTNTNVLYGKIPENNDMNQYKNKVVEIICSDFVNVRLTDLCYFRSNLLDKRDTCRAIVRDMIVLNIRYKKNFPYHIHSYATNTNNSYSKEGGNSSYMRHNPVTKETFFRYSK